MATILVVDDNATNRAFLVTLLGYGKHRMLEAVDGVEGLKMIHAERPDLVISDILMPHMDGHEFVTRIKANAEIAATPVIFYTAAFHETEARAMARSCGVSQVLAKPAEPELILRTVNEALGIDPDNTAIPTLTAPPSEGSRFSTIDNQIAEFLVELESSSLLIAQLVATPEAIDVTSPDRSVATSRLAASLAKLTAASGRLSALVEISREVAAEDQSVADMQPAPSAAAALRDYPRPALPAARPPAPVADDAEHSELSNTAMNAGAADATDETSAIDRAGIEGDSESEGLEGPSAFFPKVSRERAKFQARLAKALQFAGYPHDSPTQLAREFNFRFSGRPVTIHAARKWLVGESIPTQDKLRILAQWLGVTAEWLRFGDAEQLGDAKVDRAVPATGSEESRLLAVLHELDPYHRRLAHDFVRMLAEKHAQEAGSGKGSGKSKTRNAQISLD